MLKVFSICLILIVACFTASVPCTQNQATSFGNATDCTIVRVDSQTITWGAVINFKVDSKWSAASYSNVLADMTSPRMPIAPSKSNCISKEGSYTKGQNVLINCTQAFSSIPTGYVNSVSAFDHTDYPLGFSIKIPLSMSLQQE